MFEVKVCKHQGRVKLQSLDPDSDQNLSKFQERSRLVAAYTVGVLNLQTQK